MVDFPGNDLKVGWTYNVGQIRTASNTATTLLTKHSMCLIQLLSSSTLSMTKSQYLQQYALSPLSRRSHE